MTKKSKPIQHRSQKPKSNRPKIARDSLNESEQLVYTLLQNMPDIIILVDRYGKILATNRVFEPYNIDEVIGNSIYEYTASDNVDDIKQSLKKAFNTGKSNKLLILGTGPEGPNSAWYETRVVPIAQDGKIPSVMLISTDVTEHKNADDELRRKEEYFRALIENSLDAIVILNKEGAQIYASPSVERIIGEFRTDKIPFESIHSDDIQLVIKSWEELIKSPDSTIESEFRYIHTDGSCHTLEVTGRNLLENPIVNGIVVNFRDISERKQKEEELIRLSTAFTMATDSIVILDTEGKIVDINEATLHMNGLNDVKDMIGESFKEFLTPEDQNIAIESLKKVKEDGRIPKIEFYTQIKNGRRILVEASGAFLKYPDGKPMGYLAIVRDITDLKKAEKELRESEERYRLLSENASDVIWTIDIDGEYTYISPSILRQRGFTVEEMIAANVSSTMTPESFEKAMELVHEELIAEKKGARDPNRTRSIDVDCYCKDGSIIPLELTATFLRDDNGTPTGILGVSRDISERKRTERIIQHKLRLEETISRISSRLISAADTNEAINDSLADIGRLSKADRSYLFLINEDGNISEYSYEWCAEGVQPQLDAMQEIPIEAFQWLKKKILSGEVICIEDTSTMPEEAEVERTLLIDNDIKSMLVVPLLIGDRIAGFMGLENVEQTGEWSNDNLVLLRIISEITGSALEKKQAERALIESEKKFKEIFNNVSDEIFYSDIYGTLIDVNERAVDIFGHRPEEVIGRNFAEIDALPPDELDRLIELFMKCVETGEALQPLIEVRGKHRKGYEVPIEMSIRTVTNDHGELTGFLGIMRDISERKRAEEEKLRMEQQFLLTGRLAAVGELAAGVAHELNNPLAAVQAYAELISSEENLDENLRKDLETIFREAQRASRITGNLLSFARKHEPEKRSISINEVVEKSIELNAYRMKVNNIEVTMDLDPDLPKTMADFHQLQQVFVNLLNNAEQAMTESKKRGKLHVKSEISHNMIRITLTDNGPGIPENNLRRIFDPFFTTKEVGKGTGLGLSLCFGIIEQHAGRIYAKSKLGKGTSFFVEIPITTPEQAMETTSESTQSHKA